MNTLETKTGTPTLRLTFDVAPSRMDSYLDLALRARRHGDPFAAEAIFYRAIAEAASATECVRAARFIHREWGAADDRHFGPMRNQLVCAALLRGVAFATSADEARWVGQRALGMGVPVAADAACRKAADWPYDSEIEALPSLEGLFRYVVAQRGLTA
jgi:hypothetical protein